MIQVLFLVLSSSQPQKSRRSVPSPSSPLPVSTSQRQKLRGHWTPIVRPCNLGQPCSYEAIWSSYIFVSFTMLLRWYVIYVIYVIYDLMRGTFFVTILPALKLVAKQLSPSPKSPCTRTRRYTSGSLMYQYTPSVGGFAGMPSGASTTVMLVYFLIKSSQMVLKMQDWRKAQRKLEGSNSNEPNFCFASFHLTLCWLSLLHTNKESQTKRLFLRSAWCSTRDLVVSSHKLGGEKPSNPLVNPYGGVAVGIQILPFLVNPYGSEKSTIGIIDDYPASHLKLGLLITVLNYQRGVVSSQSFSADPSFSCFTASTPRSPVTMEAAKGRRSWLPADMKPTEKTGNCLI